MHEAISRRVHVIYVLIVAAAGSLIAQSSAGHAALSDQFPDVAEIRALVSECRTYASLTQPLRPDFAKLAEIMDTHTQKEWLTPTLDYFVELAAARDTNALAAFRVRLAAGVYATALRIDAISTAPEVRERLITWLQDGGFAAPLALATIQTIEAAYLTDATGSCGRAH